MNYQCLIAATKEQLLQFKDNLIKILYFPHSTLTFQRDLVRLISLLYIAVYVADGLKCDLGLV